MSGTIIVGLIIAVMFLASFTEWFYHLAIGINEALVRDIFFYYRLGVWIAGGVLFMGGMFWVLALNTECPLLEKERPGIFKYLNCDVYWKGRSLIERKPVSVLLREAAEELAKPDN